MMKRYLFVFVATTVIASTVQCLAQKQLILNPFVNTHATLESIDLDDEFVVAPIETRPQPPQTIGWTMRSIERHKIPFIVKPDGLYLAPVGNSIRGNVRKFPVVREVELADVEHFFN